MRIVARHLWVVVSLLSGGCEQSKVKTPESLVGAKHLPSASELSRETIQINRWGGPRRDHLLTYELRPDNSLIVTHLLRDKVLAREAFALAPDAAGKVRSTLSRVRPEALRGIEYVGRPVGCQPPTDSGDEVAIAFIDERNKIGIFDLPHVCKDGNADTARRSIAAVMKALPSSKVASAFP
jgi:hypothetical protein